MNQACLGKSLLGTGARYRMRLGLTWTGFTQEKDRGGKYKKVSSAQTARTFYRWSLISGDSSYAKLADHVIEGERIFKRESKMKS